MADGLIETMNIEGGLRPVNASASFSAISVPRVVTMIWPSDGSGSGICAVTEMIRRRDGDD